MKNLILYYYNLNNITITPCKDKIIVKNNNEFFWFVKVLDIDEVSMQYKLTKNLKEYFDFVLNKENSIFTKYKENYYVLLKVKEEKVLLDKIINPLEVNSNENLKSWIDLWSKKCDFIEYQMNHIINKYKVIDESIDYYIGLVEVAIEYLNYNEQNKEIKKYLTHKRIDKKNFYNPLNVKIDIKERDLAGYLKLLFLEENYNEDKVKFIINKSNLNYDQRVRLFSRLLFPSHYFDIYDQVVAGEINEDELEKIVLRTDEYEVFLKMIFNLLNKKNDMPHIHFL